MLSHDARCTASYARSPCRSHSSAARRMRNSAGSTRATSCQSSSINSRTNTARRRVARPDRSARASAARVSTYSSSRRNLPAQLLSMPLAPPRCRARRSRAWQTPRCRSRRSASLLVDEIADAAPDLDRLRQRPGHLSGCGSRRPLLRSARRSWSAPFAGEIRAIGFPRSVTTMSSPLRTWSR